jgi:hypothetical protein
VYFGDRGLRGADDGDRPATEIVVGMLPVKPYQSEICIIHPICDLILWYFIFNLSNLLEKVPLNRSKSVKIGHEPRF